MMTPHDVTVQLRALRDECARDLSKITVGQKGRWSHIAMAKAVLRTRISALDHAIAMIDTAPPDEQEMVRRLDNALQERGIFGIGLNSVFEIVDTLRKP